MTTVKQQTFSIKRNCEVIISSDEAKNYSSDDIKGVIKAKMNPRETKLWVNN